MVVVVEPWNLPEQRNVSGHETATDRPKRETEKRCRGFEVEGVFVLGSDSRELEDGQHLLALLHFRI